MIVGAGMAGLLAAHLMQDDVVEMCTAPSNRKAHKAVLRFRSPVISELTGIPFKQVTVHKGIWHEGKWAQPSITLANMYSKKVLGKILPRSIWDISTSQRWLAPLDFYDRMLENVGSRISWGTAADFTINEPIVSTAPLHSTLSSAGMDAVDVNFHREMITVVRHRIPNCSAYQTVYVPDPVTPLYRATLSDDILTQEFMGVVSDGMLPLAIMDAFDIDDAEHIDTSTQSYGKIEPIPEHTRKAAIAQLTDERNIYSLGRFATWRNILLDDLPHDIAVIKKLILSSKYDRKIARSTK